MKITAAMAVGIVVACLLATAGAAANVKAKPDAELLFKWQGTSHARGTAEHMRQASLVSPLRDATEHSPSFLVGRTEQSLPARTSKDTARPAYKEWFYSIGRRALMGTGALVGAIVGALAFSAGDYSADVTVFRSAGLGGCVGGLVGLLAPLPSTGEREKPAAEQEKEPVETNKTGNVTELAEPTMEKFHQLALTAVALSKYEEALATNSSNKTEALLERAAEKKAVNALKDITERINTTEREHMVESEGDFEDIQEVLSQGDTAEFVTAESAKANSALVTANDVARVQAGKNGSQLRGEDFGPLGDVAAFQGDMIPASKTQLALFQTLATAFGNATHGGPKPSVAAGDTWPGGVVKFCFASDVSARVRHIFLAAANQYHVAVPCLQFVDVGLRSGSSSSAEAEQRCNEGPAIFVQSNPAEGCYSYVGVVPWKPSQRLQLQDPGCLSIGTSVHEIGHALGMAHEQSRPDRDQHVKIHWSNIQSGNSHNFEVDQNGFTGAKYDVLSIMHYDRFAFARDRSMPTIEYIGQGVHDELGQRVGLSSYDVGQLEAMYRTEDSSCKGNALAGMGCINKPDDNGNDQCNIQKCNSNAVKHCCACGGGVQVQCYENQACPKSDPLPDLDASECIEDATHLFQGQGYPCIYTNVCKFDVEFTCPGLGCSHKVSSKKYEAAMCNNQYQTEICAAKSQCKVFQV